MVDLHCSVAVDPSWWDQYMTNYDWRRLRRQEVLRSLGSVVVQSPSRVPVAGFVFLSLIWMMLSGSTHCLLLGWNLAQSFQFNFGEGSRLLLPLRTGWVPCSPHYLGGWVQLQLTSTCCCLSLLCGLGFDEFGFNDFGSFYYNFCVSSHYRVIKGRFLEMSFQGWKHILNCLSQVT